MVGNCETCDGWIQSDNPVGVCSRPRECKRQCDPRRRLDLGMTESTRPQATAYRLAYLAGSRGAKIAPFAECLAAEQGVRERSSYRRSALGRGCYAGGP